MAANWEREVWAHRQNDMRRPTGISDRDWAIFCRRVDGETYRAIAADVSLSVSRVGSVCGQTDRAINRERRSQGLPPVYPPSWPTDANGNLLGAGPRTAEDETRKVWDTERARKQADAEYAAWQEAQRAMPYRWPGPDRLALIDELRARSSGLMLGS